MKRLFKSVFFITLALIFLFTVIVAVSAAMFGSGNIGDVGIIGGADGPTAIFITETIIFESAIFWILCVILVLFIVSAIGWLVVGRK